MLQRRKSVLPGTTRVYDNHKTNSKSSEYIKGQIAGMNIHDEVEAEVKVKVEVEVKIEVEIAANWIVGFFRWKI